MVQGKSRKEIEVRALQGGFKSLLLLFIHVGSSVHPSRAEHPTADPRGMDSLC